MLFRSNGAPGDTLATEGVNARLIAAAPELLGAGHAVCLSFNEPKQDMEAERKAIRHAYDLMRAAIAKAEGRQ